MSASTSSQGDVGPSFVGDLHRFEGRLSEALGGDPQVWVACLGEAGRLGEAGYPVNLAQVDGAPPCLFVRGTLVTGDALAVSVVGTRRASAAGLGVARRLGGALASAGVTVVSGLARGIDAAAHLGALSAGGRTIAVLGGGLCCVYPPEHAGLASQIAASGAVVSQWWPWSPPTPEQFRRRDAVSSGLALATLVVEAGARSGARLQGRMARSQGRLLMVTDTLVGAEDWARSLVDEGSAVAVSDADHVLEALRDRTLVDSVRYKARIYQSSDLATPRPADRTAGHPSRPVVPGQSRQLRLDLG